MLSTDFAYAGNTPEKQGTKTSLTIYSPQGEIQQVTTYNPKGEVRHIEKYKFDQKGNKTAYSRFSGAEAAKAEYQKFSRYDENGLVIEESGFDGVDNFKNLYTYNSQMKLTQIRYEKNNQLAEKRVFEKHGIHTQVSIFSGAGALNGKLIIRYDANGNVIEEILYGLNQSELEKKTFQYDNRKNLTEEKKFKLDKIALRTIYTYNSTGNLIEIWEEQPGADKFLKKSIAYNDREDIIEIRWRRKPSEEFNRITYTYDNRGLRSTADTYYPATQYKVLTRYQYTCFD